MSDKRLTYEDLSEDAREIMRVYRRMDRPHQRAMHLLADLFHESPSGSCCWVIRELEATAEALRECAHALRCQEQQAERERRKRLRVVEGGKQP